MWEWLTWAAPALVVLGTALVAYQIGHARGWAEGYHTSEIMYEQSLENEAKAWDAMEDSEHGLEA